MARLGLSSKRLQIDKANTAVTITVALSVFVVIFSLFACKALLATRAYQNKVIAKKQIALNQLNANAKAVDELVVSYKEYAGRPENIIGGSSTGTGDRDGDNGKVSLDSLPSKYDFPAIASSLEKLVTQRNFKIVSLTGTDEEVQQATSSTNDSADPQPIAIPFKLTVKGGYDPMQDLIKVFDLSIRPIQPQVVTFTAISQSKEVIMIFDAKTYFLPEKT